jgi:hypothetical protein
VRKRGSEVEMEMGMEMGMGIGWKGLEGTIAPRIGDARRKLPMMIIPLLMGETG